MKQILLTMFVGLALIACNKSEQQQADEMTASLAQVDIKVPTIQCNSCVANVEAALKEVEGVNSSKTNLQAKITQVSFDPAKSSLAAMEKAIAMAGYDANDTKRDSTGYAELDACCKLPEDRAK